MRDLSTDEMEIFEESFDIALSVLLRNQELSSFEQATRYLGEEIAHLMCRGERSVVLLSNFALDAYRQKNRVHLRVVQ